MHSRTMITIRARQRRRVRGLTENQWEWITGALVLGTTIAFALAMPVLAHWDILP